MRDPIRGIVQGADRNCLFVRYGDTDYGILLQSVLLQLELRVGCIYVLYCHSVCLGYGVQRLPLQHHVGVIGLVAQFDLLLGNGHRGRHIVLLLGRQCSAAQGQQQGAR